MLSDDQLHSFVRDGFVTVRAVVPADVAEQCVDDVWADIAPWEVLRADPATWQYPVLRFVCPDTAAFRTAWQVLWPAFDQLVGSGRWVRRPSMEGTVPVRFPHPDDPRDAGWHVEGSFLDEGDPPWSFRTNLRSRERGLFALVLLTDVGDSDAPTRIRVGSHLDVPAVLAPYGDKGVGGDELSPQVAAASAARPVVLATGKAGDVFLCHPFLVHAASWPHRGRHARMIGQPGVELNEPLDVTGGGSPVETAVASGLARQA